MNRPLLLQTVSMGFGLVVGEEGGGGKASPPTNSELTIWVGEGGGGRHARGSEVDGPLCKTSVGDLRW